MQNDACCFGSQTRENRWIGGWLGGFVWVVILSMVELANGQAVEAGIGLLIAGVAGMAIVFVSPWRYPQTRYRLLMAPLYLLILVALGWAAWSWDGWRQMGFTGWWSALILLPVLTPLWTAGNRRWEDGGQDN